nr:TetR/AcrR family transcriptional regulator [Paenibacillus sp. VKM B-2647]
MLDAAEALVQVKGCRRMTLQDIIRQTGLSKGAIYHYVSGKDELLGMLLQSRVEQMNVRFAEAVTDPATPGLGDPLRLIAESMVRSASERDVTSNIFIYMLSRMDNSKVNAMVREMYAFALQTCTRWIDAGKMHGAIAAEADSAKLAEPLILFMYGMRVQRTIMQEQQLMTVNDLVAIMSRLLQP